jgi:putative transposase
VDSGLGQIAQVCRAMQLARSGYYRVPKLSHRSRQSRERIVALSHGQPRYGYRRITALLRREGEQINAKRVARVRRAEGLQATQRNEVWSWDFVVDQTQQGSVFRILTLIDEHTRECLATHVAWSIRAVDVLGVLEDAMHKHGVPQHVRSDNGPEFVAYAIQDWMKEHQIKTLYIKPGSPWENGYIESFHDKMRDECLNREVFGSLTEASVIIGQWRREYNERRPHSSLRYSTPAEVAARCQTALRATPCTPFDSEEEQLNIKHQRTHELHL